MTQALPPIKFMEANDTEFETKSLNKHCNHEKEHNTMQHCHTRPTTHDIKLFALQEPTLSKRSVLKI